MKSGRFLSCLLGAVVLAVGASQAAWAVDYNGTLAYGSTPPTSVTFQGPFGPVSGNVGVDLDRFNLGSAFNGSAVDVTFTTHGSYNPNGSVLAVLFATDPNDAIVSNPSSLAAFVDPTTNLTTFLNAHVTGWQYAVVGSSIVSNGTTNLSTVFTPPITFAKGTTYYAFVAGGSAYNSGALVDSGMSYTLSVGAVPEPETWGMLLVGLGLVGLKLRRRA